MGHKKEESDSDQDSDSGHESSSHHSSDPDQLSSPVEVVPRRPTFHPWLGQRAILSLAWVSYSFFPIITLFLSLALLQLHLSALVADGQKTIEAACSGIDQVGSYAVSLPHYLALGTNTAISDAVAGVLNHASNGLGLAITALEGALAFIINSYLGPFLCLLQFVIDAAVEVLTVALAAVDTAVNAAANGVISAFTSAVSGVNSAISDYDSHIPTVFGKKLGPTISTIDTSDLSVSPVHLDLSDALTSAASSIPTPADITQKLMALIDAPLEDLRNLITTMVAKIDVGFNIFPIPDIDTISICTGENQKFVQEIGNDLQLVITCLFYALAIAALVLFIVLATRAWWECKLRLAYVESVRQAFFPEDDANPTVPTTSQLLAFYEASQSPALSMAINAGSKDPKRTWFTNFITHPSVVVFFFIGAFGFLCVEAQLLLTSSGLRQHAESLVVGALDEFGSDIRNALNDHLSATSLSYSEGVNNVGEVSNGWDSTVGEALQSFTLFINTTVVQVYDEITGIVTDIFGSGPYGADVQQLINCIIGSKLDMLETALTFVYNNANLSFPTMSSDVFLLSDDQTNDIVAMAVGNGTNSTLGKTMSTFLDRYEQSLVYSGWLYLIYLAIVVLVLIAGTIGVLHGGNIESTEEDYSRPAKYHSLAKRRRRRVSKKNERFEVTESSGDSENDEVGEKIKWDSRWGEFETDDDEEGGSYTQWS